MNTNLITFRLGPTEPRHDTTDPAWGDAMVWLRDHPECQSISAAVLSAFLAGARRERLKLGGEP
jgi:hypothetical protein